MEEGLAEGMNDGRKTWDCKARKKNEKEDRRRGRGRQKDMTDVRQGADMTLLRHLPLEVWTQELTQGGRSGTCLIFVQKDKQTNKQLCSKQVHRTI